MGWSFGGRAVLTALARHTASHVPFTRAIAFYPDCRGLDSWKSATPVLLLLGGDDDMTPAKLCQDAVAKVAVPAAAKTVIYAGARHGFDVRELPAKMQYGFATIGHHPQATAAAQREVEEFLRRAK